MKTRSGNAKAHPGAVDLFASDGETVATPAPKAKKRVRQNATVKQSDIDAIALLEDEQAKEDEKIRKNRVRKPTGIQKQGAHSRHFTTLPC